MRTAANTVPQTIRKTQSSTSAEVEDDGLKNPGVTPAVGLLVGIWESDTP